MSDGLVTPTLAAVIVPEIPPVTRTLSLTANVTAVSTTVAPVVVNVSVATPELAEPAGFT